MPNHTVSTKLPVGQVKNAQQQAASLPEDTVGLPAVKETAWAPVPVWIGAENFAPPPLHGLARTLFPFDPSLLIRHHLFIH